jgi:hypothetical protein
MGSGFWADVIVVLHVAYVSFVLFGLLAILIGAACGWRWVRNPWFRALHLLAIGIVVFEALYSIECPLTTWEHKLRVAANETVSDASFMGRLFHNLLFYDLRPETFTKIYVVFGLLVLSTFFLAPPRRPQWLRLPQRRPPAGAGTGGGAAAGLSGG